MVTLSRGNLLITVVVLTFTITLVEMIFSYKENKHLYKTKDTLTNIYFAVCAFIVNLSVKAATFFVLNFFYGFHLFKIENVWVYWIVLFVAQDFLYWLLHYVCHYSRVFWAAHITHHSSDYFNLTTGFRSSVLEPVYRVFFYVPLAFMGFSAIDILFMYLITQTWGNLVHTQTIKKLHPIIEYIMVTPSHHRVHHASNLIYLDKNMGMVFIIWDRLFGTFQEELDQEELRFGITKKPDEQGPVDLIFHEFSAIQKDIKKSTSFVDKLKYIFYPPGWSHDNSTQIASVMQKEYWQNKVN
ncbi:sterol desaturase family protein [Solitalea canadensis]|uniref:Sterol desaturase n=1 Tax=Solitalea canadensis (strain ATCC 29591 / DSM 3403 / JCM 21819 / LMG 8368 / NBRC 15130 / NCIMB 12057 / USAM 9D) TaxID=929556 RepID=H8KWB1_SOLCM|nr:sterol desaturase family protein [Solitalea canadensis]AFD07903.1 sterol desaturase [Solitalea canadensis DSM 3403]